jgi:predicted deacetylase
MNDTDYKAILAAAFDRIVTISRQREELDNEGAKLRQFIMATINMLPDDDREEFVKLFEKSQDSLKMSEESLKEACLRVLRDVSPRWLTAAQVRDQLKMSGFNFDAYMSNPLASVSTTLRRMKPEEAETMESEGVAAYRFNQRKTTLQQRIAAGRLGPSKLPR